MQSATAPGRHPPGRADAVDAVALARDLARELEGEVRFDAGSRALYATDASNYRMPPIGVVVPRTREDVVATVAICRRHGAPITSRGGGTSLAGQTCNRAVVIDFSKYLNHVLEIDAAARRARVEPGTNLDVLRRAASRHGLTFGPDPATHDRNTLGGMIGNDSCGVHSVMAEFHGPGPNTRHQVDALDVLTYDGARFRVAATGGAELDRILAGRDRRAEIHRSLLALRDRYADEIRRRRPRIPRCVSGYPLQMLLPEHGFDVAKSLVGTEGTCVVVLAAELRLIPALPARKLVVLGYPTIFDATEHIGEIREHQPVACEGIDDTLVRDLRLSGLHAADVAMLPDGRGWLLVEVGADSEAEADARARRLVRALSRSKQPPSVRICESPEEAHKLWIVRESGLAATAHVPGLGETHPGWEDSAVPPDKLPTYLRKLRALFDRFGYHAALYGHFGQGCVHCRIDFGLMTREGVRRTMQFLEEAADLVVSLGGSLSGEHGDGQARAWLLPRMYGEELVGAFREFKRIWDPDGRMNPGKVVDPLPPDRELREGPEYAPWIPATTFHFGADGPNFAKAAERCVGVGLCRRDGGGVMCPSYMVTREEEHSTRGRARLLFEMIDGDLLKRGWRDRHVREALDLCLACKGCRSDCPVHVDMATYKAEFLSHYYRWWLRPRSAYAMGWIHWWARAASHAPRLANALGQHEPTASVLRWLGGIARERELPRFAETPFTRWFAERPPRATSDAAPRVILWPDTFTNYLEPHIARAAVTALEHAGARVEIPSRPLCCGRPLYDWGMLGLAKRLWRRTLDTLRPAIRAGVPVVGLEPSCVAAFRDELVNLFPYDRDARRLSQQTFLLSEWIERSGWRPPALGGRAIVQPHCHHHAVIGLDAERALFEQLGVDARILDAGCCGMAGAFGFEASHYSVSMAAADRALLPAVRSAPDDARIVAGGFSCRTQIRQATGRAVAHPAELLAEAIERVGDAASPSPVAPEGRSVG